MGGAFTDLTGWQPGDEAAWRDACRYALNRAKEGGWDPWYGAAAAGITGFDGIDQSVSWDPDSQTWDYEANAGPAPLPSYNPNEPPHPQENAWSCSQDAAEWALWAYGRQPDDDWMEQSMIDAGVINPAVGLTDASGLGLAQWLNVEYEEFGYEASNQDPVLFDQVAAEAAEGKHPLMIGGRAWGHWSGCSGYDAASDLLILKNPAAGWQGVYQTLSRQQFAALGPFSLVRVTHPEAEGEIDVSPPDYSPWEGRIGSGLLELMKADGVLPAQDYATWLPLGRQPAQIEEAIAEDGTVYRWLLATNAGYRYRPA
jgi:hypothetical protein